MPIFDFKCMACGQSFEGLVRSASLSCPRCGNPEPVRLFTVGQVKVEFKGFQDEVWRKVQHYRYKQEERGEEPTWPSRQELNEFCVEHRV